MTGTTLFARFEPMRILGSTTIRTHLRPAALALALAASALTACRTTQTPLTGGRPAEWTAGHAFDHVLVVVLENRDYLQVVHDPYMQSLAARGALLTNFHGVAHPSYPNYLAMIGGSTFGVQGDTQRDIDGRMIADLLEPAGLTWAQYAENYPGNCYIRNTAGKLYARKHVPFMSFRSVQTSPIRCANVLDASHFDRAHLPSYAFYTPNMQDDGHDAETTHAVAWLRGFLEPILADTLTMRSTLIEVTFDESANYGGTNQIYTVLLGGAVRPGVTSAQPLNHYSMLRTVEANFGLGTLGAEAKEAPIVGIWRTDSATASAPLASPAVAAPAAAAP